MAGPAWAGGILSVQTGDWEDPNTWTGGIVPTGVQSTVVPGHTVTITEGDHPHFYFWDEGDGGGTVDVTPTGGTPATIWVRGTNQKFEGELNINEGAFMRISNATGSAHFSLRGNARMEMAGKTEWFSDNDDARIFVFGTSELAIRGSAGKMALFGQASPGHMGRIQVFENGVLDAEYANFTGDLGVLMNDGAGAGASIHIKDSIFNGQTSPHSGATIFNENADTTILVERTQFTNQGSRAIMNKSRVELIDATLDGGWTLGDLVIFSGSSAAERWAASYAGDASGAYELLIAETDAPISYQACQVDPTLASDVSIHPDLGVFSPHDGHESSTTGAVQLTEDGFGKTLTLAPGVTFDLNGFTLTLEDGWNSVNLNDGVIVENGGQIIPEPATVCLLALGALALHRRRRV